MVRLRYASRLACLGDEPGRLGNKMRNIQFREELSPKREPIGFGLASRPARV
jgi:hypothetical protein